MLTFKELLTAYFGLLEGKDRIKYYLILRYWDRVSTRLREEHARIVARAEENQKKLFMEAWKSRGSFLSKIKKSEHDAWRGGTLLVPFTTEEANEVRDEVPPKRSGPLS